MCRVAPARRARRRCQPRISAVPSSTSCTICTSRSGIATSTSTRVPEMTSSTPVRATSTAITQADDRVQLLDARQLDQDQGAGGTQRA